MTSPLNDILRPLAEAATKCAKKLPWCTGTWKVSPEDLKLYFDYGKKTRSIYLPEATETQLDKLAKACQPATFGLNQEDVLDENYRKAGKMDLNQFSINFNPERLGIAKAVQSLLLGWDEGDRNIVLEPYKLNVYGVGSFFKAHKDTPRGEKMFGSLVIVLPTPHQGGGLVLRHDSNEAVFDSAKELTGKPPGTIAFVAFYSDVEHEVLQVTSGNRVTITYNLYFSEEKEKVPLPSPEVHVPASDEFSDSLKSILANPAFFPKGGLLGFGLKHQYPLPLDYSGDFNLEDLLSCLKGQDTVVLRACKEEGLSVSLKIVYDIGHWLVMCDAPYGSLNNLVEDEEVLDFMRESFGGVAIWPMASRSVQNRTNPAIWKKLVKWVTPMKSMTTHTAHYMAYG
ncbi:hypothetical protein BD410DRAFT_738968, partial [Rickenella mellea]